MSEPYLEETLKIDEVKVLFPGAIEAGWHDIEKASIPTIIGKFYLHPVRNCLAFENVIAIDSQFRLSRFYWMENTWIAEEPLLQLEAAGLTVKEALQKLNENVSYPT